MASPPRSCVPSRVEFDHSITYRDGRLRNTPHRMRLRSLLSLLETVDFRGRSYADVGCSTGYITSIVSERFQPAGTTGWDHNESNLSRARAAHRSIDFRYVDLGSPLPDNAPKFDIVTCLETLEHTGDLELALNNVLCLTRPGGTLILSVPIEIGVRGTIKFGAKLASGYRLQELPQRPHLLRSYLAALLSGQRTSCFRDQRDGWGTHFGFDYRDLDDLLIARGVAFHASNQFTTRLYRVGAK